MRQASYSTYASSGPKVWFKWMALMSVFGGFGFLVWYASMNKDELQSSAMQPALIEPQAGPVKVRAENPGGMQVPNRDKRVFDLLEDPAVKKAEAEEAKTICKAHGGDIVCNEAMPKVAEIKRVQEAPKKAAEKIDLAQGDIGNMIEKIEEKKAVEVKPEPIAVVQPTKPAPAPKKVEEPIQVAAAKIEPVKVVTPKSAPKPVAAKVEKVAATGKWGVQLASYRGMKEANNGAAIFSKKFKELQALNKDIQKADVKGKTYYRLRFIGLGDKTQAAKLCKTLKAKGQGCLRIKG